MLTKYLLPLIAVVSFTFAIIQMTKAQQTPAVASPPVDPGKSPFGRQVAGAGIVEPETENIAVGTHVAGIVKAVHVRVDDRVRAGMPLFDLDDRFDGAALRWPATRCVARRRELSGTRVGDEAETCDALITKERGNAPQTGTFAAF